MRGIVITLILLNMLFLLPSPEVFASPDPQRKPIVAVLPSINNSALRGGHYVKVMVDEMLAERYSTNEKYIFMSGQYLIDGLAREGIVNIAATDNETLLAALRNMRADYCIRTEVQFVVTDQRLRLPTALILMKSWEATVPLRVTIFDVTNGSVFYDAVITENGKHESFVGFAKQSGAVRDAMYKVFDRFGREVALP